MLAVVFRPEGLLTWACLTQTSENSEGVNETPAYSWGFILPDAWKGSPGVCWPPCLLLGAPCPPPSPPLLQPGHCFLSPSPLWAACFPDSTQVSWRNREDANRPAQQEPPGQACASETMPHGKAALLLIQQEPFSTCPRQCLDLLRREGAGCSDLPNFGHDS